MKRTHGGIPEAQAKHWDKFTYQGFGEILYKIISGHKDKRIQGWQEFHTLKRWFMVDEWNEFIERLDQYRIDHGFEPVTKLIDQISSEITKKSSDTPPPKEIFTLPDMETLKGQVKDFKNKIRSKHEAVEQLSLF